MSGRSSFRCLFFFIVFISGVLASPFHLFRRDDSCNGSPALCGRKYSNVTFIGTHDSPFVGPLPTQNQIKSVKDQLNSGIRFLQAQTHSWLGGVWMCHTNCFAENAGLVQDYLNTIKTWLDSNPREVVTLLWTNPDKIAMSKFDSIFKKVGATKYVFTPSTSPNALPIDQWPTLGDMINANQRLVVFIDYGADQKAVPYLLDEFNHYWENEFDSIDRNMATCNIDRSNKVNGNGQSSMYIINHFLDVKLGIGDKSILVPDRDSSGRINAATGPGSVGEQGDRCVGQWGRYPNVMLVDYFGNGNELNAQNMMNGI